MLNMAPASYYPPSPPHVPVDLTAPTPACREQVALVLISVFIERPYLLTKKLASGLSRWE